MDNYIRDRSFGVMKVRFDSRHISEPSPDLFNPEWPALAAVPVEYGGRQAAWFVQAKFGAGVLRHYRRGGLMARINRCHYFWTGAEATRSFAEFQLLAYMEQVGLPVPRPLAACYTRKGMFYTASILIQRISQVQTLAKVLSDGHHEAVAAAVFSMHNAGVWHADLNAYNILVNEQGKVWLIDFDKGRQLAMTAQYRTGNLARLQRSLIKVAGPEGGVWWNRFNQAYTDLVRAQSPP